jgi:tetratricopeptide (TPR) repeat protein
MMKKTLIPDPASSPEDFLQAMYEMAEPQGKAGEALGHLLSALDRLPPGYLGAAYKDLSICYSLVGDVESAIKWARQALAELDDPSTCFYLAELYAHKGDVAVAARYARMYLDDEPDGEFASPARALLTIEDEEREEFKHSSPDLTPEQIDRLLEIKEEVPELLEGGETTEAIELLREGIQQLPTEAALQNNLTVALVLAGRYEEAVREAEIVLTYDPEDLHALCNLARLHQQLGHLEKASQFAERAKKSDRKKHSTAFEKLCECLTLLNDHQGMYELCQGQLTEHPQDVKAMFMLAAAATRLRKFDEAKQVLSEIKKLRPDLAKVVDHRLKLLGAMRRRGAFFEPMSYDLTFDDVLGAKLEPGEFAVVARLNPALKTSVLSSLRNPDVSPENKKVSLRVLEQIGGDDVEAFLYTFIQDPEPPEDVKVQAMSALRAMGIKPPYLAHVNGALREMLVFRSRIPEDASEEAIEVSQLIPEIGSHLSSLEGAEKVDLIEAAADIWVEHCL